MNETLKDLCLAYGSAFVVVERGVVLFFGVNGLLKDPLAAHGYF